MQKTAGFLQCLLHPRVPVIRNETEIFRQQKLRFQLTSGSKRDEGETTEFVGIVPTVSLRDIRGYRNSGSSHL